MCSKEPEVSFFPQHSYLTSRLAQHIQVNQAVPSSTSLGISTGGVPSWLHTQLILVFTQWCCAGAPILVQPAVYSSGNSNFGGSGQGASGQGAAVQFGQPTYGQNIYGNRGGYIQG